SAEPSVLLLTGVRSRDNEHSGRAAVRTMNAAISPCITLAYRVSEGCVRAVPRKYAFTHRATWQYARAATDRRGSSNTRLEAITAREKSAPGVSCTAFSSVRLMKSRASTRSGRRVRKESSRHADVAASSAADLRAGNGPSAGSGSPCGSYA